MEPFKPVGLNPLSYLHHNDHLGPLCAALDAPLLLTDLELYKQTQHYYPGLDVRYIEWGTLTPDYLAHHFNIFIHSDMWEKSAFKARFKSAEEKYKKRVRSLHCPHGFSDKGFWFKECVKEDITLIYGENMLDLLQHEGVLNVLGDRITTGNYRYTYYKTYQDTLDTIVQEEILSALPPNNFTILYAPTWNDQESSSSFFSASELLMRSLPDEINFIVKLHPQLEENDIATLYTILGQFEARPNIHFIHECPLISPLLSQVDLYLGDTSSVGYDFLAFNRPMVFLNEKELSEKDRRGFLYQCGTVLSPSEYPTLYSRLDGILKKDSTYQPIRDTIYAYTFGEERTFEQLKKEVEQVCCSNA